MLEKNPHIHTESDSFGLGQAVGSIMNVGTVLLKSISSAIGHVYEPRHRIRMADAKAYEVKVLADADAYRIKVLEDAKSIAIAQQKNDTAIVLDDAAKRVIHQEIKRQLNLDDILSSALDIVGNQPIVTENTINADWLTRFINISQDVSEEEMKNLWAQVLAKEAIAPGSFSLRTLECLKNLSKEEANLFVTASSLVMQFESQNFIFRNLESLIKAGLNWEGLQKLVDAGLINSSTSSSINGNIDNDNTISDEIKIVYGDKVAFCNIQNLCEIPIFLLTTSGEQIYTLVDKSINYDYFMDSLEKIKNTVDSVSYSTIISKEGDKIEYKTPTIKI